MRKLILFAITMCLFASPMLAQETDESEDSENTQKIQKKVKPSELIIKLEVAPNGQFNADGTITSAALSGPVGFKDDNTDADKAGLNFAAEYFYYFVDFIGVGAGFKQQFNRHIDRFGDMSVSNFYLALKPRIQLKPKEKAKGKEYVYLLMQGGYGFFNNGLEIRDRITGKKANVETKDGFYYGGGIGFEFNNFVFEIMFTVNETQIKGTGHTLDPLGVPYSVSGTVDGRYTATNINFGYKFGFNIMD